MTTANDLFLTCRDRYLLSGQMEQRNRLLAPYTAGDTTLSFQYDLRGIKANTMLCVGMNTFYVWEVDETAKTAQVEGGQAGSTDQDAPFLATVNVSPRYQNHAIFDALNEEIVALSSPAVGLYAMQQVEFPYVASRVGYDLTAPGLIKVHEVRYAEPNGFRSTPRMDTSDYRLERNYTTDEDPSTFSLLLHTSAFPGQNVTVLYQAGFTPFTALTDDVSITNLPAGMLDIPPMGAALRLMLGKEVRRNQTQSQGDTRRAEEVTAGAVAASTRGLQQAYQKRINDEVGRLHSAYPPRY